MVNKAELRQFITQYFSDLELNELCFDYYPDLLNQFTSGMTKSQKVIALLGYCDRRGMSNHLLTTLAKLRTAEGQGELNTVPKTVKPAVKKSLYWGVAVLAVVMLLGCRSMDGEAGGGSRSEVSGITSVTRPVEGGGAGADPTLTLTRRPTELPTATSILQPTDTPLPTLTKTSIPTQTPTPAPTPTPTRTVDIRTVSRGGVAVEQVFVPAGSFMMGSEVGRVNERPVHEVTLDAFWIDRTEVTNAQFELFVADTGYQTRAEREGRSIGIPYNGWNVVYGTAWDHPLGPASNLDGLGQHPVVHVSWDDATAFCEWSGGRLPTEAEWEYAARGPEGLFYPWGDAFDGTRLNFCDQNCLFDFADQTVDDGYEFTAPVGSYTNGTSWVGAVDMAGNVWEWVQDRAGGYGSTPQTNPQGPSSGGARVLRGTSYFAYEISTPLSFRIDNYLPSVTDMSVGFRCAQD